MQHGLNDCCCSSDWLLPQGKHVCFVVVVAGTMTVMLCPGMGHCRQSSTFHQRVDCMLWCLLLQCAVPAKVAVD